MRQVTVFAPATVANVAVGFDILGFPIEGVGDRITVTRVEGQAAPVLIEPLAGAADGIPTDPARNTATVGLLKLHRDLGLMGSFGFKVCINKGIPIGSGMGGSAASAVGGIVAANALLDHPLPREDLLAYALEGEVVATGAAHADNIAPCLFGGLLLSRGIRADGRADVVSIPVPEGIRCVVVHPAVRVDTRAARAVLKREVGLEAFVGQTRNLAAFLAGCFRSDLALVASALTDIVIEPQRSRLIPGFEDVKKAALSLGALGCSISGSGPSVFAWVGPGGDAEMVSAGMVDAFTRAGVSPVGAWISVVSQKGAAIV